MITPRATRLLRVADLRQLRHTLAVLVSEGDPLVARDRLIVVPTRAAAAYLRRAIEDRLLPARGAVVFPEIVTRDELTLRLAGRIPDHARVLGALEREVLMAVACRRASDAGVTPPFRLRPGLVGEILDFYDALRRHQNSIDGFERLMLDVLEPNAPIDRGAERLVRQTRFLVAAFRDFERRCAETGALDEHSLRETVRSVAAARPWTHVVVAVRDLAASPWGLWACDFDLLTRVPGLERLDLVATDTALAGGLHERLHNLLPGLEEVPAPGGGRAADSRPRIQRHPTGLVDTARDREEEVAAFARRIRQLQRGADTPSAQRDGMSGREGPPALDRVALVVRRPLPYVYLARDVLRSAAVPCQMFDTLPLAGEPYAAALDLVFSFVTSHASRAAVVTLLRSPHFDFTGAPAASSTGAVVALDRALNEAGYLGGEATLATLVESWQEHPKTRRAAAAGLVAVRLAGELSALGSPQPAAAHFTLLQAFLDRYDRPLAIDDPVRERHLRARAAIASGLAALADAYARHDGGPADFTDLATSVRGWIEDQTFSPRSGATGVHIADAESAAFGDFDDVQLAGLVDGEWPQRPRRSIFYPSGLLKQIGWPSESDRLQGERSLFRDLLHLPSRRLIVSAFLLEEDAIVSASPFGDQVETAGLEPIDAPATVPTRVFDVEALTLDPPRVDVLPAGAAAWARLRFDVTERRTRRPGVTSPGPAAAYSLSALERYQDCPFKFFASEVLRLEEPAEDQSTLTARTRGRFIHEVFQRFFEDWDAQDGNRHGGPITPERFDDARARFVGVAEGLLARLPDAEAALERSRLFGSPASVGIVDVVLGLEASRPEPVVERWLEYRLDGQFALGADGGRRAPLRGVVDRVDLLAGRRLRVIDYKSGAAPNVKRALQVPVYAMCASERLEERDGQPWAVDEAAYVALSGKRTLVPVVKAGASDAAAVLGAARERVFAVLDGIARGEFPPRPYEIRICSYCAFASVCRKDYVGDE